ncbi:MAG TPA: aldo/keto reductase [Fodinibius sp.]|nr:aldo/keto reductase [Fodinibius sp.]
MDTKPLGNTDLQIPPIVFGGNVFGWTLNEKESFRMLDMLLEAGFTTIDTANSYSHWVGSNSGGESETIIGKWMKNRGTRDKMTIITKVGSAMGGEHTNLSFDYILQEAEKSLDRLQTDHIDLYLSHWDDKNIPVQETLYAYQKLIDAGKVYNIGASNLSPERLEESLSVSQGSKLPRYQVLQPEYNLYDRQKFEKKYAAMCQEENLAVIPYYSLASGFLSGKYRSKSDLDKSKRGLGVKKYLDDRGFRILEALDAVSEKHGISQAGVALAWLIHKPTITAPIASATKKHHLDAFLEAVNTDLDDEDMQQLDRASAY